MSTSIIRHNWIETALGSFRGHFQECGYTVPTNVRVSVGFVKSSTHPKALGQCFDKKASKDGFFELFISPIVGATGEVETDTKSTVNILETIAHEMVHASVGIDQGHQGQFITCAAAVGFVRPWRYTPAGERMLTIINTIIGKQGLFPAGAITLPRKKQGKSLIKCYCECNYVAYITMKNLEEHGTPICPNDFVAMECG